MINELEEKISSLNIKINRFVKDIEENEELKKFTKKINIFNILRNEEKEHVHSNMIAYLINPNESHQLGDLFLKEIIKLLNGNNLNSENLNNYKVIRESISNIDIFLINEKTKEIIVIENKINSGIHYNENNESQLKKYIDYCNKEYDSYKKKVFVILAPSKPSGELHGYKYIGYSEILKILNIINQQEISLDLKILLNHYTDVLEYKVLLLHKEKYKKIFDKLISDHKEVIDVMFEYYERKNDEIKELIKTEYKGRIKLINEDRTKVSVTFSTPKLEKLYNNITPNNCFIIWRDKHLGLQHYYEKSDIANKYCKDLDNRFDIGKNYKNFIVLKDFRKETDYVKAVRNALDDLLELEEINAEQNE